MISFKEEILITLFGGGVADYSMLEECNYAFEDILENIKTFTSIENMDFNDILIGAIDIFRGNIEKVIEDKIDTITFDLKQLEQYSDENNGNIDNETIDKIEYLRKELEDLQELNVWDNIDFYTNYLDTQIFIENEETREIYNKYLKEEIEEENKQIGFCYLDLE